MTATGLGIPGSDHHWDDFSLEGRRELHEIHTRHREAAAEHFDHPDPVQRHAAQGLAGFLDVAIGRYRSGDYLRDISHIYCSFTEMRDIFDIMPRGSVAAWSNIAARLSSIGKPLDGWREVLARGVSEGQTVAERQVESLIEQAEHLAGDESMVVGLLEEARSGGYATAELEQAVSVARREALVVAEWLRAEYLPHADPEDGVGEERYLRSVEEFLGMVIDPQEVYEWGWKELASLRSEMERVAAEVDPDRTMEEVAELLESDPAHSVGRDEFAGFVQQRLEQAVRDLDGSHFDVPEPLKQISVNLAPAGRALGAWYINPSSDWQRPGSVWYALGERERIPLWQEVSTAYHEGFPGHHLQIGYSMWESEKLSKAQRLIIWYAGYGEGWALYAERLMDELGYFELPEYRLGMLASHLFRATRVVVDIGCHLGLRIPDTAPLHAGETWNYDLAVNYINRVGLQPRDHSESEVKRYLGWPGQAISYKVGERQILDLRHRLEERDGRLDLKDFHRRVLEGGEVRLDYLRRRLLDGATDS